MTPHSPDVPKPDFDDPKEPYAFFGLAANAAQLLEQSLINLVVAVHMANSELLTQQVALRLFAQMESKTFGQLLKAARELIDIPTDLEERLRLALDKRNYLTHGFFRAHDENLMSDSGRRTIIVELSELITFLRDVDQEADMLWRQAWQRLGFPEEMLHQEFERMKERAALLDSGAA